MRLTAACQSPSSWGCAARAESPTTRAAASRAASFGGHFVRRIVTHLREEPCPQPFLASLARFVAEADSEEEGSGGTSEWQMLAARLFDCLLTAIQARRRTCARHAARSRSHEHARVAARPEPLPVASASCRA